MDRQPPTKLGLAIGIACLAATCAGLLAGGCTRCLLACGGSLRISLSQPVVLSDRFSVEVNGTVYPLSYTDDRPPPGVDQYLADKIEIPVYGQPFAVHVRWLVDGVLWFEQTPKTQWSTQEVCGNACYSGQATLQLPATLPDGTLLSDMPRPCSLYGCINQVTIHLTEPVAWRNGMALSVESDPCTLSGCFSGTTGSEACVASLASMANAGNCADIPGAIDTIMVKTKAESFTLAWYADYDNWFMVTVWPQYELPIFPPGATCSPGCLHGGASLTPPTVLPAAVVDAGNPGGGG